MELSERMREVNREEVEVVIADYVEDWADEVAQLEDELALERKTVRFLDAEFDIKQRLVVAEKENAVLQQGLQQISAMRMWAGRWTQEEIETTSHQRLIACYAIADALLEEQDDE